MSKIITPSGTLASASRRGFIKTSGRIGATSALAGVAIPHVWAQENNTVQLALIGCGGRGTGAADNAMTVTSLPIKLVAMADVNSSKMKESHQAISKKWEGTPGKVDVPQDRQFIGFDAYKNAMDALKPGDICILTTPLAFRAVHYAYAISKGLHVFMEKPVTADGPTSRQMLELAKQADAKGLKSAVGLMVRHCRARQELWKRIQDGEIGDLMYLRSYRMHGPVASAFSTRKPEGKDEVLWQIERFHSFLWASGGLFSDFYIHFIDETCWMKNAWPVKCHATGGRHYRGDYIDQNFDTYSCEYTFADGAKLFFDGRTMIGCKESQSSIAHGTKGSAFISKSGHTPGQCAIFKGQNQDRKDITWAYPQPEANPYVLEWEDLIDAIKNNKPYNEVPRGVEASVATNMGRLAAHTGREWTWDEVMNHDQHFAPNVDQLKEGGTPPVQPDADGRYPLPEPGKKKKAEY